MSKPTRGDIVKLGNQCLDNERQRKLGVNQSSQEFIRYIDLEARFDELLNEYFGVASYEEFMETADEQQKAEYRSIVDEIQGGAGK